MTSLGDGDSQDLGDLLESLLEESFLGSMRQVSDPDALLGDEAEGNEGKERQVSVATTKSLVNSSFTHFLGPPPLCPRESGRVTAIRRFLSSKLLRARAALAEDCERGERMGVSERRDSWRKVERGRTSSSNSTKAAPRVFPSASRVILMSLIVPYCEGSKEKRKIGW